MMGDHPPRKFLNVWLCRRLPNPLFRPNRRRRWSHAKGGQQKLESLTKAAEPTPAPDKPRPTTEEKPVDLSKADEKLSSLLGKKP